MLIEHKCTIGTAKIKGANIYWDLLYAGFCASPLPCGISFNAHLNPKRLVL